MKLLESAPIVAIIAEELRVNAANLIDKGIDPHLAVVLVGNNPESLKYIDIKTKKAKECGIVVSIYHIEEDEPREEIVKTIDFLSADDEVHGIIVQLPLPGEWSKQELEDLFKHIPPEKDVDGLRGDWRNQRYVGTSATAIRAGLPFALPPMVAAVCLLLDYYGLSLNDKNIVVVGKGMLVGQPLEAFLKDNQKLEVTLVDEDTDNILEITRAADILIAGTGSKDLVTYQWIKEGAVLLDCAQDVHRDSVDQLAAAVAPAKGGLGPLTVSWLLFNTVRAATQLTS